LLNWSPDGNSLTFTSYDDGNGEIELVDVATGHVRQLTDNRADDQAAVWSPDGQWIAFTSTRDGTRQLYAMRLDGSDVRRLTGSRGDDYSPAWRP
jgi:TolB protein